MTLVETLERNAINSPDKVAVIYKDTCLTYSELNNTVNRLANSMKAMGIKKGDIVGLMLPRIPEIIISFLASAKLGAIPAPINYNLTKREQKTFISSLRPSIVFIDKKFVPLLENEIPKDVAFVVVNGDGCQGCIQWQDLLDAQDDNPGFDISLNDITYLNYTSGSTGRQKGAITTHRNIYWNTLSAVETFDITSNDVHLCMFASFAHPHELFARALYTDGTIVLLDEIFPKSLVKTIKDNGVTCLMGLTPMYEMLIGVAKSGDLSSLRLPESGGMYTTPDLIRIFESKFGVPIYPVWGSTETTGIAIASRSGLGIRDNSVGKACPYYDIKVVDDDGLEVKNGEIGELIIKGPAVVGGYYNFDENKNNCFMDGWYYSGDLGRMDEEGFFYFVDRKTNMMKVAGLKVYPSEIEQVLSNHPTIQEVAVIGYKDSLKGEIPKAVVVTRDGQSLTREDIRFFCRHKLADYKIPRKIEIKDELPRMSNGKINRKVLMEIGNKGEDGEGFIS